MLKRKLYNEVTKYLETRDVVVIHGARQVGKTSLMHLIIEELGSRDYYYIDLEDSRYLELANQGVEQIVDYLVQRGFLKDSAQTFYLFIDEIQYLDNPSSFLKLFHDHYQNIKLIVSGSSSFEIKSKFKDSLVGRTVNFELYPLDFEEFLCFKDYFNDYGLLDKVTDSKVQDELLLLFKEYITYGGYPKIVLTADVSMKEKYLQQIIDTYIRKDIRDIGNIRDIDKFNRLLKLLSSQSGNILNISEVSNTTGISRQTVEEYVFILEQTYIIRKVTPYYNNFRSELFKMPKIYFYDTGIRNMLLYKKLDSFIDGNIFETAIFSELIKLLPKENIKYWRTQDKKEIDFVLDFNKKIIGLEVKMNPVKCNLSHFKNFSDNYPNSHNYFVCLDKKNNTKNIIFPWEFIKHLGEWVK
jgi:uncharacterized protein